MGIKVGDYIKTKLGYIIKVDERTVIFNLSDDEKEYVDMESTKYGFIFEEEITKHSHNIIDLVEVGDYVNGKCVFATENRINDSGEKVVLAENYDEWTDDGVISNKDIETILTHELYEANCYKVGGKKKC